MFNCEQCLNYDFEHDKPIDLEECRKCLKRILEDWE